MCSAGATSPYLPLSKCMNSFSLHRTFLSEAKKRCLQGRLWRGSGGQVAWITGSGGVDHGVTWRGSVGHVTYISGSHMTWISGSQWRNRKLFLGAVLLGHYSVYVSRMCCVVLCLHLCEYIFWSSQKKRMVTYHGTSNTIMCSQSNVQSVLVSSSVATITAKQRVLFHELPWVERWGVDCSTCDCPSVPFLRYLRKPACDFFSFGTNMHLDWFDCNAPRLLGSFWQFQTNLG